MRLGEKTSAARATDAMRRVLRDAGSEPRAVLNVIVLLTVVAVVGVLAAGGNGVSAHGVLLPLLVLAGFLISGRYLRLAILLVLAGYFVIIALRWGSIATVVQVVLPVAVVVGIITMANRQGRTMGVPLSVGSGMLKDLRERLDTQAVPQDLPPGTSLDHCILPYAGDAFSGDFVVAARRDEQLHVALTDVSGHGPSAGMRALLLSGALASLLGEMEPSNFLPAANRYLIRQGWRDGFASTVHVTVDSTTGRFCVGTAGHPIAAHYRAASGRWRMIDGTAGLLLGLFEQNPDDYARVEGVLEPGDALLLYTDGMVEGSDGDLLPGTHRLLDMARVHIETGGRRAAERICRAAAAPGSQDDRSVVVIRRYATRS